MCYVPVCPPAGLEDAARCRIWELRDPRMSSPLLDARMNLSGRADGRTDGLAGWLKDEQATTGEIAAI